MGMMMLFPDYPYQLSSVPWLEVAATPYPKSISSEITLESIGVVKTPLLIQILFCSHCTMHRSFYCWTKHHYLFTKCHLLTGQHFN